MIRLTSVENLVSLIATSTIVPDDDIALIDVAPVLVVCAAAEDAIAENINAVAKNSPNTLYFMFMLIS
ncbi:MAG: hypothetical protein WKF84_24645 [Pyrinomonadaceae bacterium]